ncbi:PHB depolymerase family esterase [Roseomonas sp. HJA6]|uniref:PHB depolymerase family esterase n=2 Tax=Roseomonas alba TaxID=2846776 RepID=A0ABS7ADJ1_9PROT|nr:PHB depolymerase family esterase [Neoroseomonas alba]MBW6400238.1 PHB depolymerase family esterase [Neoroseomonas alba]
MLEATRLTREGRLHEATALLHRALGGATAPDPPATAWSDTKGPAATPPRRTIDVDPETGDPVQTPASWMPRPLRALGALAQGPLARAPAPVPEGARFLRQTIGNMGATRDYKLYIPGGQRSAPMPMLVMLHGCTQSADDFAAGTRMNALAEEYGLLVVYPEQSKAANAQKCWNWFSPADQRRDRGEPALIAGMTRQVMQEHAVDGRRIYVAGLSAGGAAAAIMAQAYPDLYAAVGVHSGLPCGAARDIPTAFAAMQRGAATQQQPSGLGAADAKPLAVPTIVFHADQDRTVHPSNGDLIAAQVAAMGAVTVETHAGQVPGGHAYSRTNHLTPTGTSVLEQWLVHGGGHAWSGGSNLGSYTDPRGPDASREMLRFFRQHALPG